MPDIEVPTHVWRRKWVVYAKPALQGTEKVLEYLGRYVHRIAITNNRILAIDDGTATFRYKDSRDGRWKTMTVAAGEFIRRFLQHVVPKGFHKVRYYGLWSPRNRRVLRQVQLALAHDEPSAPPQAAPPCHEQTVSEKSGQDHFWKVPLAAVSPLEHNGRYDHSRCCCAALRSRSWNDS
jgi:hypothetical protein